MKKSPPRKKPRKPAAKPTSRSKPPTRASARPPKPKPLRITLSFLQEHGACHYYTKKFERKFPQGIPFTKEGLYTAYKAGFYHAHFLCKHVLNKRGYIAYINRRAYLPAKLFETTSQWHRRIMEIRIQEVLAAWKAKSFRKPEFRKYA